MAQKECKKRHNWMGKRIHWDVCKKNKIEVKEKWYEHEPAPVTENEECKILRDFNVQTDHVIEARRSDMIVIDKVKKLCQIVDFAVPYDTKVNTKEVETIEKYQDFARELRKLWNMKVPIIPVIVVTLGTTPKHVFKRMEDIGIKTRILELQKTTIIHFARFLRKDLDI